eukprot:GHRQ01020582.1.p2 GENE.GHRQ01020582.1~~GHRQ01020582.1.p2  ORF type:complete len:136 (-),score=18.44 GHRQ01020582.1:44-451(-)
MQGPSGLGTPPAGQFIAADVHGSRIDQYGAPAAAPAGVEAVPQAGAGTSQQPQQHRQGAPDLQAFLESFQGLSNGDRDTFRQSLLQAGLPSQHPSQHPPAAGDPPQLVFSGVPVQYPGEQHLQCFTAPAGCISPC